MEKMDQERIDMMGVLNNEIVSSIDKTPLTAMEVLTVLEMIGLRIKQFMGLERGPEI